MVKFLVVALLAFVFTSCTSTRAHISEYKIAPNLEIKKLKKGKCSNKSIKVTQTFSSSLYRNLNMNYAQGSYEIGTFTESQWSVSPNQAVNAQLVNMLNASELFQSVQVAQSRTKNDYILETNIEDFMQYFDTNEKKSLVRVKMSMTLIDVKSNKVLASKIFKTELPAKEFNAASGVEALNLALGSILEKSSLWFEKVCQ